MAAGDGLVRRDHGFNRGARAAGARPGRCRCSQAATAGRGSAGARGQSQLGGEGPDLVGSRDQGMRRGTTRRRAADWAERHDVTAAGALAEEHRRPGRGRRSWAARYGGELDDGREKEKEAQSREEKIETKGKGYICVNQWK
jgi:hypothetical protein